MSSLLKVGDVVSISFASYITADGGSSSFFLSTTTSHRRIHKRGQHRASEHFCVCVTRGAEGKAAQHFYLSHSSPSLISLCPRCPLLLNAFEWGEKRSPSLAHRFFGFAANNFLF
jgi:hypothetical protein